MSLVDPSVRPACIHQGLRVFRKSLFEELDDRLSSTLGVETVRVEDHVVLQRALDTNGEKPADERLALRVDTLHPSTRLIEGPQPLEALDSHGAPLVRCGNAHGKRVCSREHVAASVANHHAGAVVP